jgi:hypothetical protein
MKKCLVFILCLNIFLYSPAQQNMGMDNSNYAGIKGALLNPSSIGDSKLKWDLNVFSGSTLFDNDFLFVPKGSLPLFGFKKIIKGIIHTDLFYTAFDANNPNKLYQVTLTNEILGPSFFMTWKKKHIIGLTIGARSYTSIKNIPGNVAQNAFSFLQEKDLWNQTFTDNGTSINSMSWLDYALHYSTVIYRMGKHELTGGISLKYLQGVTGVYVKNTRLTYNIVDTSQLIFTNTNVEYGRTDFDTYRKITNYGDLNHGHGFGADIGFTYVHLRENSVNEGFNPNPSDPQKHNYEYKVGVSLLDIGSINFNRNAAAYHLQSDSANFVGWGSTRFTTNNQVDQALSAVFYDGDSTQSLSANHFKMGLPTALSIQADWNVYKDFYANATLVKGFGHGGKPGGIRPDIYSLTPRYETEHYEFSLPLSIIYYSRWQPRIGFAVRIYYFYFGGDAPFSLLGLNNFERTDFYAGIHYFVPYKKEKPKPSN